MRVMQLVFVRIPPIEQQEISSSESLPLHPLAHLHIGKNNIGCSSLSPLMVGRYIINPRRACAARVTVLLLCVVWRSLTPPSKIGKGSGEPRIIDLCHKQNSGSSNQISERNSYIILLRRYNIRALRAKAGERDGWLV